MWWLNAFTIHTLDTPNITRGFARSIACKPFVYASTIQGSCLRLVVVPTSLCIWAKVRTKEMLDNPCVLKVNWETLIHRHTENFRSPVPTDVPPLAITTLPTSNFQRRKVLTQRLMELIVRWLLRPLLSLPTGKKKKKLEEEEEEKDTPLAFLLSYHIHNFYF